MTTARPLRRWSLRLLLALLALVLIAVLGTVVWTQVGVYRAEQGPLDAALAVPGLLHEEDATAIVLHPEPRASTPVGLVFYPGAKVEAESYIARLAPLVTEHGMTVVIAKPHLGMAILDRRDLDTFTSQAEDIETWMVGGHSLGGVRSCQVAEDADALILFASYCANDLFQSEVPVLSLAGSEDGLSTPEKVDEARGKLPADAHMVLLDGASHASFGDYGPQDGDGTASLDDAAMTEQVTLEIAEFADGLPAD